MSEYLIHGETLTGIADAIRGKTGRTDPVAVSDMAAQIEGIQAGGGDNAAGVIDKSVVNITSNAAEVGQYAFCGCDQLETVSFPMATKIQGGAFIGCKSLVSVSAPNLTEIRSDATNYFMLDMVGGYMEDTLGAFSGCTSLATVDFPAAVTIGDSAFSGCTSLSTADFPLAETIYQSAFSNCTGLTNLKFPRVKTIGASDNDSVGGLE